MEVKKSPKADLENRKFIFLEIGFVAALAIVLAAFEWKSDTSSEEAFVGVQDAVMEEEIIPITQQNTPPPPPPPPAPKLTDLIEIVEDDTEIDFELEIEDVEADVANDNTNFQFDEFGEEEEVVEDEIFVIVEERPSFVDGNVTAWLSRNTNYPVIAQENGISGRVFVSFVIEKDGSVTNVKVARSVDQILDKEAIRVVSSMPKWNPGKQRNKPVRVSYTVPVNFKLQ